jgi:YjbE family integral membrane protein
VLDTVTALVSIILFDLILSGDNAVVIGMAARRLSPENRRKAIIWGGAGAVGLRIMFTAMAALLLDIPYIQAVGGVLLLYVAYKLLKPHDEHANVHEAGSLREAIQTIVLADVVMSLDNILAVGAASDGHIWLLLFGLLLSIPILLLGSGLVARLLTNFPILVYVGAAILIWTAVEMLLEDPIIHDNIREFRTLEAIGIAAIVTVLMIAAGIRAQRMLARAAASSGRKPVTDHG